MSTNLERTILAAGAVPLRGPVSERQVMVVHRPNLADWVLPKGKVEPEELFPSAAVREVAEESGARVRLGAPLRPIRYSVGEASKFVAWWVGWTESWEEPKANQEVDQTRWLSVAEALELLTYASDRSTLTEAVALPPTTPLVVTRHAKARTRETWFKPDALRPLSNRGEDQLFYVDSLLAAFGVKQFFTSPAKRCRQTLASYADKIGADLVETANLSEDTYDDVVESYVRDLACRVGAAEVPTAICSHLPVIPALLSPLGIAPRFLATGASVIAHLNSRGEVVRSEWHDPRPALNP